MIFLELKNGNNLYTSDLNDKIYSFSENCQHCGCDVDIMNNTGICWPSPDRAHHPAFRLLDKSEVTK